MEPGGRLVLTTPNIVSLRAVSSVLIGSHPGFFSAYIRPRPNGEVEARHNREYTPLEMQRLLENSGFAVTLLETGPFRSAPRPEECAQLLGARFLKHAADHARLVIEAGIGEQIGHAAAGAGLRIGGAVDHPPDPRVENGAGAHGARFQRHVQNRTGHAVVAAQRRRGPQRPDLGVRGRIAGPDRRVGSLADQLAIEHHHRADGNLPFLRRAVGEFHRPPHPPQIGVADGIGAVLEPGVGGHAAIQPR